MRAFINTAAISALSLVACTASAQDSNYVVPEETPSHIVRAIESDERTAAHLERDARRKPAEILTLAGIEEGDRVIEFASFGHYYTTLLAEAVGPGGHVYMIDLAWTEPFGGQDARAFDAARDNATYTLGHYNRVDLPSGIDTAMMVLFYHDLQSQTGNQAVDTIAMNTRILETLRPGGTFLVIDHKARDLTGWGDTDLHRIDEAAIIQEVTAAGFELVASSNLLANPEDDHTLGIRDPSISGNTDRAVLLFRKPER